MPDVGDQIGQRLVHAQADPRPGIPLDEPVRAHAQKYGVVVIEQALEAHVRADVDAQAELDSHLLHDLAALLDDLFLELERRNAEGQQAADPRITVEHDRRHAVADQTHRHSPGPQGPRR